jgi:hypothetical protein
MNENAMIDPDALYHRTFDATFAKLPYVDYETRQSVFDGAAAKLGRTIGTAYTIRDRKVVPVLYMLKKDQDFKKYATPWELRHSKIPFGTGSGMVDPLVDDKMTVIGHIGWFVNGWIFTPEHALNATKKVWVTVKPEPPSLTERIARLNPLARASAASLPERREQIERQISLEDLLVQGRKVYADRYNTSYLKQGYEECPETQIACRLITDPEGRVVFMLARKDTEGAQSSWVTPLDLIAFGKIMAVGVRALGSLAIRTIARKAAAELTPAALRELETIGVNVAKDAADEAAAVGRQEAAAAERAAASRGGAGGAGGAGRATLRGVGIVARAPFRRRVGRLSLDEMEAYLREVLANRPDLRRLMAARVMTGQGRVDAIKIALNEFEKTQGWKVVEKPAAEMQAAGIARDNLVAMRSQTKQLWINREAVGPSDAFYEHVVHDLSAHALAGRGGSLTAAELPFIGESFGRVNNGLFLLENAIKEGNLEEVIETFRPAP